MSTDDLDIADLIDVAPAGAAVASPALPSPADELRIGVSGCLLGEQVRFDGNHKRDGFLNDALGPYVTFVSVCPEVGVGMGVPRETVRLVAGEGGARMVAPSSGADWTDRMRAWSEAKALELGTLDLSGLVLKKDSPSCGVHRVKVYDGNGMAERSGRGLFADAVVRALPLLPVEEEGRLHDPVLRESFVERIFAYRRLAALFAGDWTVGDLVEHHTNEKLALLAHSPDAYRELGRLVARGKALDRGELRERYGRGTMEALARLTTRGRHTNVLQHMAGYFREHLSAAARQDLDAQIQEYRVGLVPLVVPLALVRHYVRVFDVAWLARQTYLQPHPRELLLRNGL